MSVCEIAYEPILVTSNSSESFSTQKISRHRTSSVNRSPADADGMLSKEGTLITEKVAEFFCFLIFFD